jgi:hypothetical protein
VRYSGFRKDVPRVDLKRDATDLIRGRAGMEGWSASDSDDGRLFLTRPGVQIIVDVSADGDVHADRRMLRSSPETTTSVSTLFDWLDS